MGPGLCHQSSVAGVQSTHVAQSQLLGPPLPPPFQHPFCPRGHPKVTAGPSPGVQLGETGEGGMVILMFLESFSCPPPEATLNLSH